MSAWAIGTLIWLAGALITFRLEARRLVTKKDYRRDRAIREARNEAPFWPIMLISVFLEGVWEIGKRLMLAGIPESRTDRDEAIRRLEEEVLGVSAQDARDEAAGQLHLSLQEALNGTTADEDADELLRQDMAYLDRLDASRGICGPDTRLPSGKTMGQLSPAYRPRGYVSTHRPDYPRRGTTSSRDQEAKYEAVTKARRALELLRRLAAMGVSKDPATGQPIHHALHQARNVLRDAEAGHLNSQVVKATRTQVSRLERAVTAQELIKDDDRATVCSRCGCPVVPGRRGYVHIPDLGMPSPCSHATVEPVPWHQTPEGSPERAEVYRRTMEAFEAGPFGRDMDTETMRELQREFPPEEVESVSLDGTVHKLKSTVTGRLIPEGYEIHFLAGNEPPPWNGMVTREIRQVNERITEWFEDSTLPVTRKIHREQHADAPNDLCPFCQMNKL
jgi:hypothetical protein